MSLQRQYFLLSYLKTPSVGLAGVWTRDLPLRRPAPFHLNKPGGSSIELTIWANQKAVKKVCLFYFHLFHICRYQKIIIITVFLYTKSLYLKVICNRADAWMLHLGYLWFTILTWFVSLKIITHWVFWNFLDHNNAYMYIYFNLKWTRVVKLFFSI